MRQTILGCGIINLPLKHKLGSMRNKYKKVTLFFVKCDIRQHRYIKQLKHLFGHGRVDLVTTFYAGRWSFVPWILPQLRRPPVFAHTITMASTNTLCFHFFMRQTVEANPLQDDLVFFQVCTRQKTIFRCVVTSSRHSYRNTVSVRPREDPQSRRPSFDKVQASAMITCLFLFLRPLTPVSADP